MRGLATLIPAVVKTKPITRMSEGRIAGGSEFAVFGRDILTIVVVVAAIGITIGVVTYILTALNTSLQKISSSASIPNYLANNQSLFNVMILMLIIGGVVAIAVWIIRKLIGTTSILGK